MQEAQLGIGSVTPGNYLVWGKTLHHYWHPTLPAQPTESLGDLFTEQHTSTLSMQVLHSLVTELQKHFTVHTDNLKLLPHCSAVYYLIHKPENS